MHVMPIVITSHWLNIPFGLFFILVQNYTEINSFYSYTPRK